MNCFQKRIRLSIEPSACFLWAFLLVAVPVSLLAQWLAAVITHEVGHIIAVLALGGSIESITFHTGGIRMKSGNMGFINSIICILAGPLCGCIPLMLIRQLPLMGLFSAALTAYNLLPFWPLDGGRVMDLIVSYTGKFEKTAAFCKGTTGLLLAYGSFAYRLPILLIPVCVYLREIFLANKAKKGYNSATIKKR